MTTDTHSHESPLFSKASLEWPDGSKLEGIPFVEIEIMEGLNFPFQFGSIMLRDIAFLSRSVIGGELLTLNFDTVFQSGNFNRTYTIYSKSPETVLSGGQRFFKLMFISPEALQAANISLCKRYSTSIPNIVQDVISNIVQLSPQPQGQKTIEVDSTAADTFDYIFPNIKVADGLKLLEKLCFDSDGYPYVLFENVEGIKFKSIKTLLEDYDPEPVFLYSQGQLVQNIATTSPDRRALIVDMVQVFHNFNLLEFLNRGVLNTEVSTYNPITKTYNPVTTKLPEDIFNGTTSFQTFDPQTVSKFTSADNMKDLFYFPTSDGTYYEKFVQKVGHKRATENLLAAINVQFTQHNTNYLHRAGDCINLSYDAYVHPSNQPTIDTNEMMSGRYLINKIKHIFRSQETVSYNAVLEACKLGYGGAL